MSIFNDDLIGKLKREAELKRQEENKKAQDRWEKREISCAFIMECLREFPVAAKEVYLRTEFIRVGKYAEHSIDFAHIVFSV